MATNPFYVHPGADLGLGLQGLDTQLENRAQVELARVEKQKQQEQLNIAGNMMRSGDMQGLSEIILKNPAIGDQITKSIGFKDDATKKNATESSMRILSGEDPQAVLTERVDFLTRSGGDPSGTLKLLQSGTPDDINKMAEMTLMSTNPKLYKTWKESQGGATATSVAAIQEMEYLTAGLPPEQQQQARLVRLGLSPRASESAQEKATKAFQTEIAKLSAQLQVSPQVAGAVAAAKNQSKIEADAIVKGESNDTAWNVYDNAMRNLETAMTQTSTGPIVGLVPALTTEQQTVDGAVAVMAPVLKQMFRASGEGVFTDRDQEMLIKMMPTRKDTPGASAAKIKAVDMVVRAKLGMDLVEATPGVTLPEGVTEDDIATTMQNHGMTREQVLSKLGGGQ